MKYFFFGIFIWLGISLNQQLSHISDTLDLIYEEAYEDIVELKRENYELRSQLFRYKL